MNPILFSIGEFDIRWYSVTMLLGILIGLSLLFREGKRFNISKDFLFNMAFWTIIFALIGARLYYVVFNFSEYKNNLIDIVKIWNGGLAIHGALLFGIITMFIYCKKYKVEFFKITDIAAPCVLIGQAIGRWGNFFNSEAHGMATSLERLQNLPIPNFIVEGMNINGIYYHPTFYYEFLWCLLGLIIILIVRRLKYIKIGQLTCIYFMFYSVGRFFIESMRTDSLMLGGFKMAQIVSILMFVTGLIGLMLTMRYGKFENLYNREEKSIIY